MPQKLSLRFIILCLFASLLLPFSLVAQGMPPNILYIEIEDYYPGEPFRLKAIITDDGEIGNCVLYFRIPGMIEFDFVPFFLEGEFYIAEIPPEFLETGILEYYVYASDAEGNSRTSPEISPDMNPYEYSIAPISEGQPTDIYLLSPEPGSSIPQGPELIVISLYDPDDDTAPGSVKLVVDGEDVTDRAIITRDLITYIPIKDYSIGRHTMEVTVRDLEGNMTKGKVFEFTVVEFKPEEISKFKWTLNASLESKYDKYEGREQPKNRPIDHNKPRVRATADWGWLKSKAEIFYNAYLDEDARTEAEHRQTLNRLRLELITNPLTLTVGDANPRLSELTIKGTRIRGVIADFRYKFFGLTTFYGESRNRIDPYSISEGDSVLVDSILTPADTMEYIYQFNTGTPTYQREAFGINTSFDFVKNAEWFLNNAKLGFNYLRFKDNTGDSASFRGDLANLGGYEYADFNEIEMELYLLDLGITPGDSLWDAYWQRWENDVESVEGKLGRPKDNIVMSTTLDFRLFKKTFITFETALSLLIDNQYGDRGQVDSLWADKEAGKILSEADQQLLDIDEIMADNFNFTVNDELIHTFTPKGYIKPVIYADLRTPLPFIPTTFRLNYRRIPETYNSLGNPSIQSDIDAIKVDSRTRLFKNRVSVNVGSEIKGDNLYYAKQITTTNNTYNLGLGLMFPKLPTVNLGFRLINRDGVGKAAVLDSVYYDPVLEDSVEATHGVDSTFTENITSTFTASVGYQLMMEQWRANINVNSMMMNYSDNKNSDYNFDNNSFILSTALTTPWPFGLDISYGNSINAPESGNKTTYTILNSRFNYYWLNKALTTYVGLNYLTGVKSEDLVEDPETGDLVGSGNGIDNVKSSIKAGFKWKFTPKISLAFEFENIDLVDEIDDDNSYSENRGKLKFEYRM